MIGNYHPLEIHLRTIFQCFYDPDCIEANGIFTKLNMSYFITNVTITSDTESPNTYELISSVYLILGRDSS
jgi:hypothetical protein